MKTDALKLIPLFARLSDRERRKIAGDVVETGYKKGEYIFREGDPADTFHTLKSGSVKCVKTSADGKEVTMKVLMPGDLFCCDAAVLDGAAHPGCAQPMGDVRVLELSKKAYFAMLRRNPEAALEVIEYLGRRLLEAQENTKVLALNPADKRLASLLVNLAARAGVRESSGIRLTVRLTRQDLANMVGVTSETAIRVMSRFKRLRLVSGTAKNLVIRDLERLNVFAEPPPPRVVDHRYNFKNMTSVTFVCLLSHLSLPPIEKHKKTHDKRRNRRNVSDIPESWSCADSWARPRAGDTRGRGCHDTGVGLCQDSEG